MKRFLPILLLLMGFTACLKYPYPYRMNDVEPILANRKIAILPCNLMYENKYSQNLTRKRIIEDSIKSELNRSGFEVINQSEINKDIDSIQAIFGGFYNSKTGEIDTSIVNAFSKVAVTYVFSKHNVSAILIPYLRVTKAYLTSSGYAWDGRLVKYSWGIGNLRGYTNALSLYVRIFNSDQKIVFDNSGGIQPLSLFKVSAGGFVAVEDKSILSDPQDLRKAIKIVFKPIWEKMNNKKK